MIDPIQIALTFVIVVLTSLLFIIGLQVFQIFKEFKKTLEKINKILEDAGRISKSVVNPIEEASEFLIGLKKGVSFLNSITKFSKFFKKEKEIEAPKKPAPKKPKNKKRSFTHKGKSLIK
jgi:hypothetical protein